MAYDIAKLGIRIAEMRKERNMTQEALSQILGVSPQAVSKWETGIGCPDIALLPAIAEAFGVTINDLFTEESTSGEMEAHSDVSFPPELGNLKLIASFEHRACYSDMKGELKGSVVRFADGSETDFEEMVVINRGKGNILLRTIEDFDFGDWESDKGSVHHDDGNESSAPIDSLVFDIAGPCDISIQPSKNGKTSWYVDGSSAFMSNLSIEQQGSTLTVAVKNFQSKSKLFGFGFSNNQKSGDIHLMLAQPLLKSLVAKIKGASDIMGSISVQDASISIAGSGDVTLADIANLQLKVAGSGDCDFRSVDHATINIAGSGDVKIRELRKEGNIRIAGSGDVSILAGEVEQLDISIFGSGDIDAKGLTVNELNIEMMGTGDAVIGRVRGHSIERISRTSDLKILYRD